MRNLARETLVLSLGLVMMFSWLFYWWRQNADLAAERKAFAKYLQQESKVNDLPHPVRIYIQWFLDTSITDGVVDNETWTISDSSATYLVNSARPGQAGNIIIYGHNTRPLMGNIRALKGYEKIKLTLSDGSERWYQVSTLRQVKPNDMKYLQPTNDEILTLFTCAGFADADRFVVQAKPISR